MSIKYSVTLTVTPGTSAVSNPGAASRSIPEKREFSLFNPQAPDRKSNPQAPDLPLTAISVTALFESFENVNIVFVGAENHNLTHKSELYLKNNQKLLN